MFSSSGPWAEAADRSRLDRADHAGFIQDMGGRVTRYPLRRSEKTSRQVPRRAARERWMDA